MPIDFPDKLRSTRRDRKLVDAAAIDGLIQRTQLSPEALRDGTHRPLIENLFDGTTGADTGERQVSGVTIADTNNEAYLIRVRAETEYILGATLHALRSRAPLEVGIANLYSKGDGALYRTLDEATDDALEIWIVRDLSAIRGVLEATQKSQPKAFNVFFLSSGGDDALDGRTLATAVRSIGRAMTLAGEVEPATDHRSIYSLEALNFGNLINNASIGNVPNLVVDCRAAVFEIIDLSRKSNMLCRRGIGSVTLGSGSQLEIWGSLGYASQARTVGFAAGAHEGTLIKVRQVLSNVSISLAGVSSGSRLRIEIDDWQADDFEASMSALLDTIPDGVEVNGWIGKHNFGEAASAPTPGYAPVSVVREDATPDSRNFRIGVAGADFIHDGDPATDHWTDVAGFELDALRIGTALTGRLVIERHAAGTQPPAAYYYRFDSGAGKIVPTTDGTDTAPSDLTQYVGTGRRFFYTDTEVNGYDGPNDRYYTHTLKYSHDNYGQLITHQEQASDLQLVFNFPDWDIDVASFTGDLTIRTNTGYRSSTGPAARVWNGKTRIRFNRASKNRYTMTLGDDSSFGNANVKVEDFFKRTQFAVNLNAGSHANQVLVNGQTGFLIPFIPDSQLLAEVEFSVPTVDA